MNWQDNLPDVSTWQPLSDKTDILSAGLEMTCQAVQSRIVNEAMVEERFNIRNYDAGPALEDIVRQELTKLLPSRYSVDAGVVNDICGRTAEDCDVLITNRIWAPVLKLGATAESRRMHFPVDAAYSIIEVKRTLGFDELDQAMEKLVKASRLKRHPQNYGHITENQNFPDLDKKGHILNPLRTTVLGTKMKDGVEFRDIVCRFGKINTHLRRDEMITDLHVLERGSAWYGPIDGSSGDATFMWDREKQIGLRFSEHRPENVFYLFFKQLLGHLSRSVLYIEDTLYGTSSFPPYEQIDFASAIYNP